jgi:hypothetical protein
MNHPLTHVIPENTINPPEFLDWTPADKRQAVEKLVDVITGGQAWDENCLGWKGDMFATWEGIMIAYKNTSMSLEECAMEMSAAFDSHVERHAKDEVEHDPNRYCERVYDFAED